MKNKKKTLIIGAGLGGEFVIKQLNELNSEYEPVAILDDNLDKWNSRLQGVRIVGGLACLDGCIEKYKIEHIILVISTLDDKKRQEIISRIRAYNITCLILPDVFSTKHNKKVEIPELNYSELLPNRFEFQLDYKEVHREMRQKTVLITGAGGSIGSELASQILKCHPKKLILLGKGEGSIFQISTLLEQLKKEESYQGEVISVIADICDMEQLFRLFKQHKPDIVYHAAAHKHVPLMENNAYEAVKNNIVGTYNVIQASKETEVEKFTMVSTDKAVNPENIMGATKRLAEKLTLEIDTISKTKCNVVRFGNVLGSRGSVFPKLWEQIHRGVPLTITNPEMKRYFMTIPEASKLVISASMLTQRNAIFVLDMGEQVELDLMVDRLISLSGKKKQDIVMEYVGVRPGEKMSEELFNKEEFSSKVSNKVYEGNYYTSMSELLAIKDLMANYKGMDNETLRQKLLLLANQSVPQNVSMGL
ncbi:polysaccharide biosynthesis protein [Listeria booriae]|uniref:Polysaccharide biosynthesis protein n=1 Tax=Listeria booriae TaxID=1552123 RepID=A0A842A052_9LIST|nr:polysaccharide biosynthesis protein [Listeria booriae]MBC1551406.1 polysaccharide biosynthesis protein [Listeria booriae]MBC1565957.1 polysaccharide biosynthesis protein [Listeria booriae]MBC2179929.1 polysaccharide biosynthesis protein [Listeria booriae]